MWWADFPLGPALPLHRLPFDLQNELQGMKNDYDYLRHTLFQKDISLEEYLIAKGWKNRSSLKRADVIFCQTCCNNVRELSCVDLKEEMFVDHSGEGEFRIQEGYGALWKHLIKNLRIRYNTIVTEIEWNRDGVIVYDSTGQAYRAHKCLITVSLNVLKEKKIHFTPALSSQKRQAIDRMFMKAGTKLLYSFSKRFWDEDLTYLCHCGITCRWWTPCYGRPDTQLNLLCSYVTAERAQIVDELSEQTALHLGLQELSILLNVPFEELQQHCLFQKRISWAKNPFILGGYANVLIGHHDDRKTLFLPEENVLFFAGEATAYFTNPQTVHGAIETGYKAADLILQSLSSSTNKP